MPCKGFREKRDNIINEKFYKEFKKSTGIDIDYKTFKEVIIESNQLIADVLTDEGDSFKLPLNLGYLAVTKYKTSKKPIDWLNTRKLKKTVYLTNLHSYGYVHHIKWFKLYIARFKFNQIYTLDSARFTQRRLAANCKAGKRFFNWKLSDFFSASKLDKLYYKTYKTEQ